jgi:hypothetical protein
MKGVLIFSTEDFREVMKMLTDGMFQLKLPMYSASVLGG